MEVLLGPHHPADGQQMMRQFHTILPEDSYRPTIRSPRTPTSQLMERAWVAGVEKSKEELTSASGAGVRAGLASGWGIGAACVRASWESVGLERGGWGFRVAGCGMMG